MSIFYEPTTLLFIGLNPSFPQESVMILSNMDYSNKTTWQLQESLDTGEI